jgi:hypothetical protein
MEGRGRTKGTSSNRVQKGREMKFWAREGEGGKKFGTALGLGVSYLLRSF